MKKTLQEREITARKYEAINDCLTEKGKRLWAAAESLSYGHGGVLFISQATGLARSTIYRGIKEIVALNISGDEFHPEWNYTIRPRIPLKT